VKGMKLEKLINSGIPFISTVLLVLVTTVIFLQVILREFFGFSINWSEEVAQFCMMWMTLFGSIWLTKHNRHINTGLKLHQKLNERTIGLIDSILALVTVITAAVIAYYSAIFSFSTMGTESISLPWLKMGYVYIALPLFMLTMCYYYLKNFLKNVTLIFKKK
jgi:TRAP-type C4-dicarboxylate transport system permease small subunit